DSVCAGTIEDPCYAYINFTANEDIFIYPTNYDPWGRNTPFEFDSNLKDWKLQRSWGTGWRDLPLDTACTGTWCGLSSSKDTRKFSVAFRKGKEYQIRIIAYKNTPADTVKWSAFDEIDPVWMGVVNVTLISNTDQCFNCKTVFRVCKLANLTDSQADTNLQFYNKALSKITQDYNLSVLRNVTYDIEIIDYVNVTKEFKCNSTDFNYTIDSKYACCKWLDINGTDISFCHTFETRNIPSKTIYWTEQLVGGSHIKQQTTLDWRPITKAQIKNAALNAPIGTCWDILLEGNVGWGESVKHTLEFGGKDWAEYTWWNNSYQYKKMINITNGGSEILRKWHTANITIDTATLVSGGKLQSDCDDLRVTYNASGTDVELDRVVTDCNKANTTLEFGLQANISASTTNTNEYWLYYNATTATAQDTNKSKVYLYWCNFTTNGCGLTEIDDSNYITYNATGQRYDFSLDRNTDAVLYYVVNTTTHGANLAGYELIYTWYISAFDNDYASGGTGFSYKTDDMSGLAATVPASDFIWWGLAIEEWTMVLWNTTNRYSGWENTLNTNVNMYMRSFRLNISNIYSWEYYSNSARTTAVDINSLGSSPAEHQIFILLNNYRTGSIVGPVQGWVDDVKLIRRVATNPIFVLGTEEIPVGVSKIFKGTVEDAVGVAIPNATVYIILQDTNSFVTNLTTNSTGLWQYETAVTGNYSICAHNPANVSQGGDCKPFIEIII
ncbi:MAG: carboxypeptidase-like regulatory domain-containing protein, partial [Patescibacteria group bacterium]